MRLDEDINVQVAVAAAARSRFAGSRDTYARSLVHALRDMNLDRMRCTFLTRSVTIFAGMRDNFTRAVAPAAGCRVDHATERRIADRLFLTRAVTFRARFGARPRRRARSVTRFAVIRPRNTEFDIFAECRFLKGNFEVVAQIGAAFRTRLTRSAPSSGSAAEEHVKNIAESVSRAGSAESAAESSLTESSETAAHAAGSVKGSLTELIVLLTFLRVAEHAVGFVDFLELFLGRFRVIPVQVRMIFAGQALESLLDVCVRSVLINAEDFIIIAFFAHVAPSLKQGKWECQPLPIPKNLMPKDYFLSSLTSV